jgi:diketogulonate reductase-like aldo/keto reductase
MGVLFGSTEPSHIVANLDILSFALTAQEVRTLDQLAPVPGVRGFMMGYMQGYSLSCGDVSPDDVNAGPCLC